MARLQLGPVMQTSAGVGAGIAVPTLIAKYKPTTVQARALAAIPAQYKTSTFLGGAIPGGLAFGLALAGEAGKGPTARTGWNTFLAAFGASSIATAVVSTLATGAVQARAVSRAVPAPAYAPAPVAARSKAMIDL